MRRALQVAGRVAVLAAVLAGVIGCGGSASPTPPAGPERVDLRVGQHDVSVVAPDGWESLSHGDEHVFQSGHVTVGLTDLGQPDAADRKRSLEWHAEQALADLDRGPHRELAHRDFTYRQDREIMIVETWDRLTHGMRRRFAFTVNDGSLLLLYTRFGSFEEAGPAFEGLLESLEFAES